MKLSVIIGVVHMSMGICVKGLNAVYFKTPIVFWFEVVTGLIILLGLFGWMDVLIIAKWLYPMNPYSENLAMQFRINSAPSIITVMINNFLAGGNQPFVENNGTTIDVYFFNGQKQISEMLIVIVFICVPLMLCVKPCAMLCCKYGVPHDEHAQEFERLEPGEEGSEI
jgi:V-type H+-transporting ATPase subunit a